MRVLLVQIGSMGDCLLVTTIAKQIKEKDYPSCHLTWMIGDKFKGILTNNPHVDEIIEVPIDYTVDSLRQARGKLEKYVEELQRSDQKYDKIIVTDISKATFSRYWGTYRSTFFRIYEELYGHKLSISSEPVICLTDKEILNVRAYVEKNKLNSADCYPILFEYAPNSGQSKITMEMALEISKKIIQKHPNVKVIMSSKDKLETNNENIIDASELSFRENAELLNWCKLLIGSCSGITWLNTSTWSEKKPMIQCIDDLFHPYCSASVEMDFKGLGVSTEGLIELINPECETVCSCVDSVIENSFSFAKTIYKEKEVSVADYMSKMYKSSCLHNKPSKEIAIKK